MSNFRRRLSVRLSVFLACVVVPAVIAIAALVTLRQVGVIRDGILREAQSLALTGAAAYGQILEQAIESGELSNDDVFRPTRQKINFSGADGKPIEVEKARYHTRLGDYTDRHGVRALQDAALVACDCLFASGMDQYGYVPTAHARYDHPPRGIATEENLRWDREWSRQKRMYDEPEQLAAAGFLGNAGKTTLIQPYPRDSGGMAWDVVAPITVHNQHFGGFRVGVSQDRVTRQQWDLVTGLVNMFGLLVALMVGTVFWASSNYLRPLSRLTEMANRLSVTTDLGELAEPLVSSAEGEVGDAFRAFNRLRNSLFAAMSRLGPVVVALAILCGTARADVRYRSFSASAAIGPPAEVFSQRLWSVTRAVLGVSEEVHLSRMPGIPPIPPQFGGDVVAAVAAGEAGGGFDAVYVSGGDLNRAWGFIFNSGVPFGPTFDEFVGFLYGQGQLLVDELLARRGVVAIPVVAGSGQMSGYFPEPMSDARGHRGLGLAGLCQQRWTLRFLPPGENVISQACDDLVADRKIPRRTLVFTQAASGVGSLVGAVSSGILSGFEFATPLDDVSQLFADVSNPPSVGLRFVHSPGWHQPFLITWMVFNRRVWDAFTSVQQILIRTIAQQSVLSSYAEGQARQGTALRLITDSGVTLVRWRDSDLALLRDATGRVLARRAVDPTLSIADRADYERVLEALRAYVLTNEVYWDSQRGAIQRFEGWRTPGRWR